MRSHLDGISRSGVWNVCKTLNAKRSPKMDHLAFSERNMVAQIGSCYPLPLTQFSRKGEKVQIEKCC